MLLVRPHCACIGNPSCVSPAKKGEESWLSPSVVPSLYLTEGVRTGILTHFAVCESGMLKEISLRLGVNKVYIWCDC